MPTAREQTDEVHDQTHCLVCGAPSADALCPDCRARKEPAERLATSAEALTAEPHMVPVSLDPCLAKQEPGEPMFILLARDSAAPHAIEEWCDEREREIARGTRANSREEFEHIEQVRAKVEEFRAWRKANR